MDQKLTFEKLSESLIKFEEERKGRFSGLMHSLKQDELAGKVKEKGLPTEILVSSALYPKFQTLIGDNYPIKIVNTPFLENNQIIFNWEEKKLK